MHLRRGLTIVELMTTISLAVIILTLSSVTYRRATKRTELNLVAQTVAADIRSMQSSAASGKEYNSISGRNIWGAYFDMNTPNSYVLFSQSNPTLKKYSVGEENQIVKFDKGISIKKIACREASSNNDVSYNRLAISFTPPNPDVRIVNNDDITTNFWSLYNYCYVVLVDDANGSEKNIEVNFFGLIDVTR